MGALFGCVIVAFALNDIYKALHRIADALEDEDEE